jgi:hypothetical protein
VEIFKEEIKTVRVLYPVFLTEQIPIKTLYRLLSPWFFRGGGHPLFLRTERIRGLEDYHQETECSSTPLACFKN